MTRAKNPTPEQIAAQQKRDRERAAWRPVEKWFGRLCDARGVPK